jgi:hypothetical protein
MTEPSEVEELRRLIAQWRGSGARFATEALRERAAVYAAARVKTGLTRHTVADELGLKDATLAWWLQRREKGVTSKKTRGKRGVFQRVQVVAAERRSALVAYGPRGLRIEGLSVDDVAVLVSKLS